MNLAFVFEVSFHIIFVLFFLCILFCLLENIILRREPEFTGLPRGSMAHKGLTIPK